MRQLILWICAACIVLAVVIAEAQPRMPGDKSVRKLNPARIKGMQTAVADISKGILRLKEFPPIQWPAWWPEYHALMKSECGIEYEVVKNTTNLSSESLEAETEGYSDVMKTEIEYRFGPDIWQRLENKVNKHVREK